MSTDNNPIQINFYNEMILYLPIFSHKYSHGVPSLQTEPPALIHSLEKIDKAHNNKRIHDINEQTPH